MRLNNLSKSEQFAFASDLFFMQATYIERVTKRVLFRSSVTKKEINLKYKFPSICYKQIVGWVINNGPQIGVPHFKVTADFIETTFEYLVVFENETEQDKMHQFFTDINSKRPKEAPNKIYSNGNQFPPVPDWYQGEREPNQAILSEYKNALYKVFNDEAGEILIPYKNRSTCRYILED